VGRDVEATTCASQVDLGERLCPFTDVGQHATEEPRTTQRSEELDPVGQRVDRGQPLLYDSRDGTLRRADIGLMSGEEQDGGFDPARRQRVLAPHGVQRPTGAEEGDAPDRFEGVGIRHEHGDVVARPSLQAQLPGCREPAEKRPLVGVQDA
jgi:hypothetical protein